MRKLTALLIVCFGFTSLGIGQAPVDPKVITQVAEKPVERPADGGPAEMTAADVEAFLEGILPLQLAQQDVAGATVAIVKDGKLLFSKGYGYADVEAKTPVSASETLFRPGSISKLFTWTAVMQLVEQGKLDLDRDVNEYLDYKIPDAFGKPITLKNILTHTPGFEEQVKDLITYKENSPDLGQYLKTHIPARIYPPGTVPAYSNYATAVAGYIVERVSGQPFNDYVTEHIFKPLGMNHSTFVQPLPAEFVPNMSKGYLLGSDKPPAFEIVSAFPAGSLSSTAEDMARFMLAHLQGGELEGQRILKPETVQLMHSPLFRLDEAANAMAHGFYEESRNGLRIIGHGGDTISFHSDLHLVPDKGLGFFVSYNSGGRGQVPSRSVLWQAFLDRYFPYDPPAIPVPDTAKQDAEAVSGTYEVSRRGETSFIKLLSLLGEASVSPNEDGTISVDALLGTHGKPKKWQAIGSMKFREVDGQDLLIFKPDESGRMQMIISYPFMSFERVGILANGKVLMPVLAVSVFIMILTLLLWPIGWFVRRHYGGKIDLTRLEWWLRIGVRVVFLLALIFLGGMIGVLTYATSNLDFLSGSGPAFITLAQVIGVVAAIGGLVVLFNAIHAWLSSRYRIWGKLQATLFVLVFAGFLWFVFAGHLLSFSSTF